MTGNYLVEKAMAFVSQRFVEKLPDQYTYHNFNHTICVFENVKKILSSLHLAIEDSDLLFVAALFHDLGFTVNPNTHEEESAKMAADFLRKENVDEDRIHQVQQAILDTKKYKLPTTEWGKILKDADCGHLAQDDLKEWTERLRKELNNTQPNKISKTQWLQINIDFLKHKHHYCTDFAKTNWEPKKQANIKVFEQEWEMKKTELQNPKKQEKRWGRGVESLFRIQLKNHLDLSAIADSKANILLSVNAIIISLALSTLIPKFDKAENEYLIIPTLFLLVFSLISIVMSILATRPKVTKTKITREQIRNKKSNILFFGNFYQMTLEDFEWGINYLMENDEVLYNSLMKDLYFLGLVLERKYRMLRMTYNVFMVGIVLSALAFIISIAYATPSV